MRKRAVILAATLAAAVLTLGLVTIAQADSQHGRPTCTAPPMDEVSHGSRDGYDDFHVSHPSFNGSLADLEGYLNACRTNDNPVVEGAAAVAEVFRGSNVVRVQLRAQLQQFRGGAWVTVDSSSSVNTGVNRTLAVVTPFHTVNQATNPLTQGWTRTNVRALVRYGSNTGPLVFYQRQTYPIWVDDGPVTALP
jgi:hypothetical protein